MTMRDIDGIDSEPSVFSIDFTGGVIDGISANGNVPYGYAMSNEYGCATPTTFDVTTNDIKFGKVQFYFCVKLCFL